MNITLIGFMGTGKSLIGEMLAEKTGKKLIETDDIIVMKAGKSISDIFSQDGEDKFREIEAEVVKEVSEKKNVVISCGGGVVLREDNVVNLKKNSIIVLLTAPPEEILRRTEGDKSRPLLNTDDKLGKINTMLRQRESYYDKAADLTINTKGLKPEEVMDQIFDEIANNHINNNTK